MPTNTFIVALRIHLHFPTATSLKDKRSELQRVKAAMKRLGVSVAEVGHKDVWRQSTLVASLCGDSEQRCRQQVDVIERVLEENLPQGFQFEQRVISWNDLEALT